MSAFFYFFLFYCSNIYKCICIFWLAPYLERDLFQLFYCLDTHTSFRGQKPPFFVYFVILVYFSFKEKIIHFGL